MKIENTSYQQQISAVNNSKQNMSVQKTGKKDEDETQPSQTGRADKANSAGQNLDPTRGKFLDITA